MARNAAGDAASVCPTAAGSNSSGSSGSSAFINIDPNLRKCLAEVNTMLATHVAAWMRKRGKVSCLPSLCGRQQQQC
jgi:hypothetical protein